MQVWRDQPQFHKEALWVGEQVAEIWFLISSWRFLRSVAFWIIMFKFIFHIEIFRHTCLFKNWPFIFAALFEFLMSQIFQRKTHSIYFSARPNCFWKKESCHINHMESPILPNGSSRCDVLSAGQRPPCERFANGWCFPHGPSIYLFSIGNHPLTFLYDWLHLLIQCL